MINTTVKVLILILFFANPWSAFGQLGLDYYLPEINYKEDIPTPNSILNFEIGEWHITHGQLMNYMEKLCASSNNCRLVEYARTHENKPLVYLIITGDENMQNLKNIRDHHRLLTQPEFSDTIDLEEMPLVLYQGYSIHGNESSGANAACLVAYYLLAGESEKLKNLLENTIILLDPCYNPDGLQRFSTWANSNRHSRLNTDPLDREFNEVWPGGRTNHYWFDLNRDWLFNIHPSSKGRIETFHEWKPDILTDHHEMGSNSTFFFQPGVPSRTNPNTPKINQRLTEEIGNYHASFLDSIGSMYFSKERYDDYYYGKGSTYPDINGCIGILFEQASSRGHLRETLNGLLSFPFTIRNQFVTSLSTQQAALEKRLDILTYKRDFFKDMYNSERSEGFFIFQEKDEFKKDFFVDLLHRHDIKVYTSSEETRIGSKVFDAASSYIVPKKQYQARLIKTIFEKVTSFPDSIFYDVSAWTLPLAFNMNYAESKTNPDMTLLSELGNHADAENKTDILDQATVALALDWNAYMAPAALSKILEEGFPVRIVKKANTYSTSEGEKEFPEGTIIIPFSDDGEENTRVFERVQALSFKYKIELSQIRSGLALAGESIGSNELEVLEQKSIAIIVGEGVNAYEAGDCWYLLDRRWDMKISLIDKSELPRTNLSRYDIVILADGQYEDLEREDYKLKNWIREGGTLLAFRRSVSWLVKYRMLDNIVETELEEPFGDNENSSKVYNPDSGANAIGGCILNADIDQSHPLLFGYNQSQLPVFKKGTQFYSVAKQSSTPIRYAREPRLSGYMSDRNMNLAPGSASLICSSYGEGRIIASVDNPNFRAYWLAGSKIFANMIFMSQLIDKESML